MSVHFTQADRRAMSRALELAAKGLTSAHPNPRVGCVLVKAGHTVGEGYHERAGLPHAEVMAIRAAGLRAQGATAYVTLEPCAHHGRTPPCVDALIDAGVRRVIFSVEDPNPQVSGRGAELLKRAGIAVESGLMAAEASALNAGYMMRRRQGRPFVRLKLAMSLDGRTALANGKSRWLTGEAARADVQQWRARSSAVLTGIGTVLADDPRLDVRLEGTARQPLRIILDSALRTPPTARVLAKPGEVRILTASSDASRRAALEKHGATVEVLAGDGSRLNLATVFPRLAELEMNEVLVESGASLAGACLQAGVVDEILLYVAPMLLGPQARPLLDLPPLEDLAASPRFEIRDTSTLGPDLRLILRPSTHEAR